MNKKYLLRSLTDLSLPAVLVVYHPKHRHDRRDSLKVAVGGEAVVAPGVAGKQEQHLIGEAHDRGEEQEVVHVPRPCEVEANLLAEVVTNRVEGLTERP